MQAWGFNYDKKKGDNSCAKEMQAATPAKLVKALSSATGGAPQWIRAWVRKGPEVTALVERVINRHEGQNVRQAHLEGAEDQQGKVTKWLSDRVAAAGDVTAGSSKRSMNKMTGASDADGKDFNFNKLYAFMQLPNHDIIELFTAYLDGARGWVDCIFVSQCDAHTCLTCRIL